MKNTYKLSRVALSAVCILLCISMLFLAGCVDSARDKGASLTTTAQPGDISGYTPKTDAQKFLQNIKCGWNLGNTLEATGRWDNNLPDDYTPNDIETGWGNPTTTKAMIDKVKEAGFNAVRIPVSWYKFVDDENDHKIDERWLKRVKEVVDYAYDNDMYVIVNMHHDDTDAWLSLSAEEDEWDGVVKKYEAIWKQIAEYFKKYDEKLILEGMNEPIAKYNGNDDWWGQTDEPFDRLNELYKVFVRTVRATGGNNKDRYLMIPTFGAQWYTHQLEKVEIPDNDERVIVDIHWYTATTNAEDVDKFLSLIYDYATYFDMAVILGECGVRNDTDEAQKIAWASAYIKTASNYGMRCLIWDDGGDFSVLDRDNLKWYSDAFVKAIMENAVDMGSQPIPTTTEYVDEY